MCGLVLIKSDSKDMHTITEGFSFLSTKMLSSTTVFNIGSNEKSVY